MPSLSSTIAVLVSTGGLLSAPGAPCTLTAGNSPSHFEFESSPWVNLYNFLVKEGKAARGIDDDGLGARGYAAEDTAAIRPLEVDEAQRWNAVVDFFARVEIPNRLGIDSLVQKINVPIATAAPNGNLDDVTLHPEIQRALRDAMPIYRAVWWPAHAERNRRWIARMHLLLAGRERCLVGRAEEIFRAPWPNTPVEVHATVFASWFGAYSTHHPTRITVSANARGTQEWYGVEVLLHEAAHGMLQPLDSALAAEAAQRGKLLPKEFSHLLLFYTAGALVKEQAPAHIPFADAFGTWRQNGAARRYRDLLDREWRPYLSGSRTFEDAIRRLVEGLPS